MTKITIDDLEFEGGRLTKIKGMRPAYMDGYQLLDNLHAVAALLEAEKQRCIDIVDRCYGGGRSFVIRKICAASEGSPDATP